MAKKAKSPWQKRREVLRSLSLEAIAAEVNRRRWRELFNRLAEGDAEVRHHRRRLARLFDAGELLELPNDLRAHPARMKRTLIALYELCGPRTNWAARAADVARQLGCHKNTARRGIYDLEAARLVQVERTQRPAYIGGQGSNAFTLIWPSLRDLAWTQGLQGELFDIGSDPAGLPDGSTAPVAVEDGRPDESSGRGRRPRAERDDAPPEQEAGTHSGQAGTHCEYPGAHSGHAGAHSEYPGAHYKTRVRATPPRTQPRAQPPSSPPENPQGSCAGEGGEEMVVRSDEATAASRGRPGESPGWREIERRLARYGLGDARGAVQAARARGWTADQAARLLADVEAAAIDGVPKYSPGAVWWQLVNGQPGSSITIPPRDAWTRAKRERDLAAARKREARQQADREAERRAYAAETERLEASVGERLDALTWGDLATLTGISVQWLRKTDRAFRLREVHKATAEPSSSENAAGGTGDGPAGRPENGNQG